MEVKRIDTAKLIHRVAKETWVAKANINLTQCRCRNLIISRLTKHEQLSEGSKQW